MIVAVVPAAGLGTRMGRSKPLIELDGSPILSAIVRALLDGGADRVVVVAPPRDRPESSAVADAARSAGGEPVVPDHQPADMRASIVLALHDLERTAAGGTHIDLFGDPPPQPSPTRGEGVEDGSPPEYHPPLLWGRAGWGEGLGRASGLDPTGGPPPHPSTRGEGVEIASILLAPCDMPGITPATVAALIAAGRERPGAIVVPRRGAKRGHPALLPWAAARAIRDLPEGIGVKALFDDPRFPLFELDLDDPGAFVDLDTPDDLARWAGRR